MIIHIVAGGPTSELPNLSDFDIKDACWVGVDRGVLTLLSKDIEPVMAFGDFDSITDQELTYVKERIQKINIYHPEKDEPDMELALNWAIEQKPEKIRLFGGTGGRLDHFFANVHLLLKSKAEGMQIELINKQNLMYVQHPGSYKIERDHTKKYISFFPVSGSVENLTLQGFKYPLKNRHIPEYSTLCVSNELIDDNGTFSFTKGILMVIRSSD